VRVHTSAKWVFKGSCPNCPRGNMHVIFEVCSFNRFKLVWLTSPLHTDTHTDRHTLNENSISTIHSVHLAEITTHARQHFKSHNNTQEAVQQTISVGRRSSHRSHCKLLPSAGRRQMSRSAATSALETSHLISYAVPLRGPCNNTTCDCEL